MAGKVIITCAVTGSIHTPSMSPYLPLAPEQVAEEAMAAAKAGGIGADPENLTHLKRIADKLFGANYRWSVLAAGRHQMPLAAQAALMGGNVRVGLEDSLYLARGQLAPSNADQVRLIRSIIESLGLEVATPAEVRSSLELKGRERVRLP